ncbi:hypothetical protein DdX_04570 [Ditylenchus destructor]|uniref:Uncharacterized protein n=1 Tax=Ditylenchus destructor TaxID=166010 RepID=A0AAD4NER4_9BILA|nr:hypothetical protein DdX_04570 [Ditylenchus destructor]
MIEAENLIICMMEKSEPLFEDVKNETSVTTTISSLSTTEPIPWTVKQIVEELLKTYRFPECFVVFSGLFDSKFSDSSSNISVAVMLTIERILSSEHVDNMCRLQLLITQKWMEQRLEFKHLRDSSQPVRLRSHDSRAIWSRMLQINLPQDQPFTYAPLDFSASSGRMREYRVVEVKMKRQVVTWILLFFGPTTMLLAVSWVTSICFAPCYAAHPLAVLHLSLTSFAAILLVVLFNNMHSPSTPYLKAVDFWNFAIIGSSLLTLIASTLRFRKEGSASSNIFGIETHTYEARQNGKDEWSAGRRLNAQLSSEVANQMPYYTQLMSTTSSGIVGMANYFDGVLDDELELFPVVPSTSTESCESNNTTETTETAESMETAESSDTDVPEERVKTKAQKSCRGNATCNAKSLAIHGLQVIP